jgi:pimeloyl-ACP methyl ester carboxylesterase
VPVSSARPTVVLIHGAGHTSHVWSSVQDHLRHRSLAIDLPGRGDKDGDLSSVTIDDAAESVAMDVTGSVNGPLVLVGHSAGGIVLPAVAARLGSCVRHLVFVAGLCAREGHTAVETFNPGETDMAQARVAELRHRYRGHRFAPSGSHRAGPIIDDARLAMSLDSMNYITQPISWMDVSPTLPRTFVRCLRDALQSREVQARLAADCGAADVIDIDAGHRVADEEPAELAEVLDRIADELPARSARRK